MYRGTPSWELNAADPDLVGVLDARAVRGPGRAIDIGCGTGDNAIELARRGFETVDVSERALSRAREKATAAGVHVDFRNVNIVHADDVGSFDLAVDRGLFMSLPGERNRKAYAAALERLVALGGHSYQFQWVLPDRPRAPSTAWFMAKTKTSVLGLEEFERRLGGAFTIETLVHSVEPVDDPFMRRLGLRRIAKASYWLTRR